MIINSSQLPKLEAHNIRTALGTRAWRTYKSSIQGTANRSLDFLLQSLKKEIRKDPGYFLEQFENYTQRAYRLGLKASGVSLTFSYKNFQSKFQMPNIFNPQISDLIKKDKERLLKLKLINSHLDTLIRDTVTKYFNRGRIDGSPLYSVVYFTGDHTPLCEFLNMNSPWPNALVPEIPSCCSFRIVPKSNFEYKKLLRVFPSKEDIEVEISNILKNQ